MRSPQSLRKIGSILLAVILLPALVYSVYELNSLNSSEQLLNEIYQRQLDVILFSLNQYSWDVANSWASALTNIMENTAETDERETGSRISEFLSSRMAISTVLVADTAFHTIALYHRGHKSPVTSADMRSSLEEAGTRIARLKRLQKAEYRKLEPVIVSGRDTSNRQIALVFLGVTRSSTYLLGFVLEPASFIREALSTRINDVAGDEFILAVVRQGERAPVYSNVPVELNELRQRKELWLFPDYTLGIRVRGETIDEVVRARFYRNLFLLLLLDLILIGGAWIVYRTLRQEMELVRLKSDFVSNVSHELRTPLSLIRMYAETLHMGRIRDPERVQGYYATMLQETERLTRLINNILNFSRMEAGKKQYQMRETDLSVLVEKVLEMYAPHLESLGFTIASACPEVPPILGDEESLAESLINILDNAAKYSDADKRIRVATGVRDGTVFVEVEDHGIGIAPEQREKIFEKFYRISGSLVHNTKGSGLGLALVKYIVEAHGGAIRVRSAPGEGSTFTLSFPAQPEAGFQEDHKTLPRS
jgi:two-component system phosphate regulon sensor histidine kinase PhoR